VKFQSCKGKAYCRDDGKTCLTCGRSLEEIDKTRALIALLADAAVDMGYDDVEVFTAYIGEKAGKSARRTLDGTGSPLVQTMAF
jgi:hypothetical protein